MKIAELGPLRAGAEPAAGRPEDRDRVLAFLKAGKVLRAARSLAPDELDPQRTPAVPIAFLTDGSWVWSSAIIYYAELHDIPVDPELTAHARDRDFIMPTVPDAAAAAALAALDDSTGRR